MNIYVDISKIVFIFVETITTMKTTKPFILAHAIRWWGNAGTDNHLGGHFNLSLYVSFGEHRIKNPDMLPKQNKNLKLSHSIYPTRS